MPKTPNYFKDKTIFITGAASGIGKSTARIFAREGSNVVATDIDEEGAIAHLLEFGGGEQPLGIGGLRRGCDDEVGLRQEPVERVGK